MPTTQDRVQNISQSEEQPQIVLFHSRKGGVEAPTVDIDESTSLLMKAMDLIRLAGGIARSRKKSAKHIKFRDVEMAMATPAFFNVAAMMDQITFDDLVDLIRRLVASTNPRLHWMDGKPLRVRVNFANPQLEKLKCPIYGAFSRNAEAVVFYAYGPASDFLEWARDQHPSSTRAILALDLLKDKPVLLIPKVTSFKQRPDLIRTFGLL